MATGEHADVGAGPSESLPGGRDLSGPERVLCAAGEMEADLTLELARDRREVPSLGVAAVLSHEPRGAVQEHRAATAAECAAIVTPPPSRRRPPLAIGARASRSRHS